MATRDSIMDIILQHTERKPYCFVMMHFNTRGSFFSQIKQVIEKETSLYCLRADEISGVGYNLLDKVHQLINLAELVIADISELPLNVMYEIGYATAIQKPMIIIADRKTHMPANLSGLEVINYDDNPEGLMVFQKKLIDHVIAYTDKRHPLLQDMLIPAAFKPSYIIANPKHPDESHSGHPRELRTYGDFLGVTGILGAFAAIKGAGYLPEVVGGKHAHDKIKELEANLFLIGSKKVNNFTGYFLETIQSNEKPKWSIEPASANPDGSIRGDQVMILKGPDEILQKAGYDPSKARGTHDLGIIIRSPHPKYQDHIVMVMAGSHALGTGAACIAATRSQFIEEIQNRLPAGKYLGNKSLKFWVLVKGTQSDVDKHLDESGVSIVDVGVYG